MARRHRRNIIDEIIDDIQIELTDEFHKNFERKAFFKRKWKPVKKDPGRGSLMLRTGALRSSLKWRREGYRIVCYSDLPYANIHNQGGTIKRVSKKGKRYSIKIPKRQFMGQSRETTKIIKAVVDEVVPGHVNDFVSVFFNNMNNG